MTFTSDLLDPGEREHAVSKIREWAKYPENYPGDISADTINDFIVRPLRSWLDQHPEQNSATESAMDLLLYGEDIAGRFANGQMVIPEQADRLDNLWGEFLIAYGLGKVAAKSKAQKVIASKPRKEQQVTREVLENFRNEHFSEKGFNQGWIKAASAKFGLSRDAISKRWKNQC